MKTDKHDPHGPGSGNSCLWYTWFILQEVTELFIDAWSSVEGNESCVERLLETRNVRNAEQYDCEAEWLHDVIMQRSYRSLGGAFNEHAELVAESVEEKWMMVEGWIEESGFDAGMVREGDD